MTVTADHDDSAPKVPTVSDAFGEVFFVCVIGLLPLVLFGLGSIKPSDSIAGTFSGVFDPVAKGQLFLYTFSLFGSLLWTLLNQARIYTKLWLSIYGLCLAGPAVMAIYFYGKAPAMDDRLNPVLIGASIVAYWLYVFVYFRFITHIPDRVASFGKRTNENAKETARKAKGYIG